MDVVDLGSLAVVVADVVAGVGDDNDGSFMVVSVSGAVDGVGVLSMLSVEVVLGFDTVVGVVMAELKKKRKVNKKKRMRLKSGRLGVCPRNDNRSW